ncbi:sugar-binding transcriptional regulator [Microbacterium sp. CJ88]|uniref:sugar-binding transcriptional regulator n=1 Tax=Microbacterium sp. CJ88 TaxID=3445672 RepID=UPI003F65DAEF
MTAPRDTRAQDALRAAQLYYLQDLTMDAIAHEMRVSRSSVSRLLAHARDTGLVSISVHSPQDARGGLERLLMQRFGIAAHVVPTPGRISEVERLERTALSAARILTERVDSSMTIGIAWGSTLSAVGRHLPLKATHDSRIVQMNGAANVRTSGIPYAGEILSRFGAAWSASVHQFPVPALFDDPLTKQAMWRERSVRAVLRLQELVDVFVFGLGSPRADVPSHVYSGDYFDAADLEAIPRQGIVGDCATVFYRADGSADGIELNERSSGPSLEQVRGIPSRFCIVSSLSKLDSLRGALAAGLITELVVEESLARRLIEVTARTGA